MKKLLIIIPDRVSTLIKKGEVIDRYYNPGNLFDEVHILITNSDKPNKIALQRTVGNAKLYLHNLPFSHRDFLTSFGLRPWALYRWAKPAVQLAREIEPRVIRCYGDGLNAFLAYKIKEHLRIPYVVSLHNNPDEILPVREGNAGLSRALMNSIKRMSLGNANLVIPVYESALAYARRMGAPNIRVIYNQLNGQHLRPKKDYELHSPVHIISVGRHFTAKNPENLIRAMKSLPNAQLTLIGDGPIQRDLERAAQDLGLSARVIFIHSMPNDDVCDLLVEQDIFAIHIDNLGISKTTMEAMLSGLPCVINQRNGPQVPELQGGHVMLVENSAIGYADALLGLIGDEKRRKELGQRAYEYARNRWAPEVTEAKYAEVYRQILDEGEK